MKWAWAMGSEDIVLPENVGLPFGGKGQNWFILQTHYYNPKLDAGVNDSSGVRVYFTTELRPEEAGMLELNAGTGPWQRDNIPAGKLDYTLQPFVLPSTCTASYWAAPITILGAAHHMHLTGFKMEINVVREGRNLGLLRNEKFYDFKHQSSEGTAIGQLLPGDEIFMNCHYDTTGVTEDVAFGELTQNEMCYAVAMYYPLQERENFGYAPQRYNATQCYTAGTGMFANSSACAQGFFDNVPIFFEFEDFQLTFDALTMCNSEWYETDILPYLPGTCPECYVTRSCTAEEVAVHGQNVVCPHKCNRIGVSVYPNISLTNPYNQGLYGCEDEGSTDYFTFMPAVELPESPNCTAVGDLSQVVELTEAPTQDVGKSGESSMGGTKSGGQTNAGSLFFGFVMVVFSYMY
jgi:Copper type II ascorbate-dependent monooxygenase, C-terminal domain/Copper type II ascorbate-dependent monooxygenase, N-terminal domain